MKMTYAFIQGASRGIGFQFVQALLKRPNTMVFAGSRTLDQAGGSGISLLDLKKNNSNLETIQMDVTNEENIVNAAKIVKEKAGKLELLINCSAVLHPTGRGETKLGDVHHSYLTDVFNLNTFAPLLMTKHFAPLLQKGDGSIGSQQFKDDKTFSHSGVIVNMSARIGSITDNKLGGWYAYRMSKSALNMANKCASIELARGRKHVVSICLHPGTVNTDLTRPYHRGIPKDKLFSTEHSVDMLLKIIDNVDMKQSGNFTAFDGEKISF